MNKLLPIYIVLFLSLISAKVLAACSAHVGKATLNEIMKEGGNNGVAFIEIDLLDLSITPVTYDQWTMRICHDEGNDNNQTKQCKSVSVADMNDATPWIWAAEPIIDKDYIDFQDGFDLSLLDGNGQFIDYIQIKGYSGQNFQDSCRYDDLQYVFPIPSDIENGTKILLRKPDGTGEWKESKNLNEYPPTPGGGNDGDPVIHHFEIDTLNGQGLTCEPDVISVKACSNVSCNTLIHDAVDVVLSVSDGNGVVLNKNITVVGGEIDVEYIHTKAEVVNLSLDQTYICIYGDPATCDVAFSDAGFRFISSAGTSLPVQLSGKPSKVGYNADTLKIEAVETDASGACAPLLVTGSVIDMAASYQTPSTGTKAVNISGTDIGMAPASTAFDSLPFTGVALDFGGVSQHSAEYIFTYPDAGAMQLHARYELPDDDGNPSGNFIKGSSNSIYVRPFAFDIFVDKNLPVNDIDYKVNPAAVDASGGVEDVFTVAGGEIRIKTRATVWKSGDDANINGFADQGEVLTDNDTTENFTGVTLTSLIHGLVAPISGTLGDITVPVGESFNLGVQLDSAIYSEVGIISLLAQQNNYLAAGINIEGTVPYVGRFIPDHFILEKIDGDLAAYCDNETLPQVMPFAYSGQMSTATPSLGGAIRYSFNPSFTITAKSLNGANTTLNYTGDFMKLVAGSIIRKTFSVGTDTFFAPMFDGNKDGSQGTKLALTSDLKSVTTQSLRDNEALGVVTYTYRNEDNFVYHHELNAETNIFATDINLPIVSVIDEDDVTAQDADGDFDGGDPSNALDSVLTLEPAAVEIRFGRAQLQNSFGPETSNLPQPLSVNYFEDGQYKIADTDQCTPYNATNMTVTNTGVVEPLPLPLPDVEPANGDFITEVPPGITRAIELAAPGAGNTGQVCISYNILPWLQYKWATDPANLQCAYIAGDVDGLFNDNPFAIATFGIYRGNDRIIYQREIEKTN